MPAPADLEALKRASVAQLLFRCARLTNERALATLRERYGVPIRAAHTALFPHIDLQGSRQSELARKLGISKQAVNQLVAELEQMGALERVPDPSDQRATLVRFSRRAGRSLADGLALLAEIEAQMSEVLGERRMRELHATLLELDAWLSKSPEPARARRRHPKR